MTQSLYPLYGEIDSDQMIGRASASNAGWVVAPLISIDQLNGITLTPDPNIGFFAWKSPWVYQAPVANLEAGIGQFLILEDAPITIPWPSPWPNLFTGGAAWLVGRWKWIVGSLDNSLNPTGLWTPGMAALYAIEAAPDDFVGSGDENYPQLSHGQPDTNGRYGTILTRLHKAATPPYYSWSIEPSTFTGIKDLSVLIQKLAPIDSPTFTGFPSWFSFTVLDPTDNSSYLATTAWVHQFFTGATLYQSSFSLSSNNSGTTDGIMLGLAIPFTPRALARIQAYYKVNYHGTSTNNILEFRYGTGTPPNPGDSPIGTEMPYSGLLLLYPNTNGFGESDQFFFKDGLTKDTAYWFDFCLFNNDLVNPITIDTIQISIREF